MDVLGTKYRVLLTEVLPFERPLRLDGDSFCINMQDNGRKKLFEQVFMQKTSFGGKASISWTIPFDYKIRKVGGQKSRKLSLPHPYTQLEWVDFYEMYAEYMIELCSKSPFSIRHISNKSIYIFKDVEADDLEDTRVEIDNPQLFDKRYQSYFTYKKYDMMYKFFSSGDYLRLEQKYPLMMSIDVANCFYNIYTHSVAWAIKGKEVAKRCRGNTFENNFDKQMRYSNYNETNGIIVGPEFSRIFAEVILQKIDLNVMSDLQNKGLKLGKEYEIRRYVDDYFIYAYSEDNLNLIKNVISEQLEYYKMFINPNKISLFNRPFLSALNAAKYEVSNHFHEFQDKYLKSEDGAYTCSIQNEFSELQTMANSLRIITSKYHLNYGEINRFALSIINNQIKREQEKGREADSKLLLTYTEMAFYLFSLDMSCSASLKLCRIIERIYDWNKEKHDEIKSRILREAKRVFDIYLQMQHDDDANLEILNLLIALKSICDFVPTVDMINSIYHIDKKKNLNYFEICSILYIIENNKSYSDIKQVVKEIIKDKLIKENSLSYAENAYLYFDVMTCPYLEESFKKDIIRKVLDVKDIRKYKDIMHVPVWFFDWNKNNKLSVYLEKREYHTPYE